ncbi:MAG: hypothetical protein NTW32_15085, partial [Chloroflexi bacterium]|nr:hypothetical protein [Chloroflexota bacterium]
FLLLNNTVQSSRHLLLGFLDFVNHIILKKVSLFMPFLELLPPYFLSCFFSFRLVALSLYDLALFGQYLENQAG